MTEEEFMGIFDATSDYKPKENKEFTKKEIIGECVAQLEESKVITSKKDGTDYYLVKCQAINVIDRKKAGDTLEPGDEVSKIYNLNTEEGQQEFKDDMFTADIKVDTSTDEAFALSMEAAKGSLLYFRCWAYEKKTGGRANPVKILSANKITDENSTPQVSF